MRSQEPNSPIQRAEQVRLSKLSETQKSRLILNTNIKRFLLLHDDSETTATHHVADRNFTDNPS